MLFNTLFTVELCHLATNSKQASVTMYLYCIYVTDVNTFT